MIFGGLRQIGQRGDTIVEVLISMAIISLVLAGAYTTSTRNSALIQGSQEREQAQRLVEGQIENLRSHGGITGSGDCFDSSGTEKPSTDSSCSARSAPFSGASYVLSITGPVGTNSPSGVYTVMAVWSSLGGKTPNDSKVTMYYRLN
jgi:prepilin-type N-terminal cleavage/methylation domain-containing protein